MELCRGGNRDRIILFPYILRIGDGWTAMSCPDVLPVAPVAGTSRVSGQGSITDYSLFGQGLVSAVDARNTGIPEFFIAFFIC